eukprot:TRINITY_DN1288_c0_g2_i1.p1 TRINITY_DN1288_c0_g2~~TRINITY_DN1288_c0_g2_i1.p1  ORF type:complete len:292 (+),score=48.78 TRINITY_DN1288_c0_g2_i1:129-1004(+)
MSDSESDLDMDLLEDFCEEERENEGLCSDIVSLAEFGGDLEIGSLCNFDKSSCKKGDLSKRNHVLKVVSPGCGTASFVRFPGQPENFLYALTCSHVPEISVVENNTFISTFCKDAVMVDRKGDHIFYGTSVLNLPPNKSTESDYGDMTLLRIREVTDLLGNSIDIASFSSVGMEPQVFEGTEDIISVIGFNTTLWKDLEPDIKSKLKLWSDNYNKWILPHKVSSLQGKGERTTTNRIRHVVPVVKGKSGAPIICHEKWIGYHVRRLQDDEANMGALFTEDVISKVKVAMGL